MPVVEKHIGEIESKGKITVSDITVATMCSSHGRRVGSCLNLYLVNLERPVSNHYL